MWRREGCGELDEPVSIRSALAELASGWGVEQPLETARLFASWEQVVGVELAKRMRPSSLKGGVLKVRVDSWVWASEMRYLAPEIIVRINEALGSAMVSELKPWVGKAADKRGFRTRMRQPEAPPKGGSRPSSPDSFESRLGGDIEDQALARALKRAFKAAHKKGK